MLRKSSIGHRKFLHAEHCRYGTRDLSLINAKSSGMVHRQWEPARVFSGYSVRKACIGSIWWRAVRIAVLDFAKGKCSSSRFARPSEGLIPTATIS
jgi:hypothetical protein